MKTILWSSFIFVSVDVLLLALSFNLFLWTAVGLCLSWIFTKEWLSMVLWYLFNDFGRFSQSFLELYLPSELLDYGVINKDKVSVSFYYFLSLKSTSQRSQSLLTAQLNQWWTVLCHVLFFGDQVGQTRLSFSEPILTTPDNLQNEFILYE